MVAFGLWVAIIAVTSRWDPAEAGLGTWTGTGPEGGLVNALAIDPKTTGVVYAGTAGAGVFKSATSGSFWTPIREGLANLAVSALAIDPHTPANVYAGTGGGVFKSIDGGATWTATGSLPGSSVFASDILALAVDPKTPPTLYAGGIADGVYKSTNGGIIWNLANTGLPADLGLSVRALAIHPQTTATVYVGTLGGLFKSTNGGGSWTPSLVDGGNVWAVSIDPQVPTTLYAGASFGVFKSTDAGASWRESRAGIPADTIYSLAVDPQTPLTLYAGTQTSGVFKSSNGGASWSPSSSGLPADTMYALASDPLRPASLYVATQFHGVFKSTDGGANWRTANVSVLATTVEALAADPQTPGVLYAGTVGSGIFKSSNGGVSWVSVHPGLPDFSSVWSLAIDPKTPAVVYAGTPTGVFKSMNGGATWKASSTGLPTPTYIAALAIDPMVSTTVYAGIGYAPDSVGVYRSTDGGASWSLSLAAFVYSLAVDPRTPAILYAGTSDGIFKSTDEGANWGVRLGGVGVTALAIDPQTPSVLYAGTEYPTNGVFKSTNGGATWTMSVGLGSRVSALATVASPPSIYAATDNCLFGHGCSGGTGPGVFKSTDGGASWTPLRSGLRNLAVAAFAADASGTCLHAGSRGAGVVDFATRIDANCLPPPPLVAAFSAKSQSVAVGTAVRTFATVENRSGTSSERAPGEAAVGATGVICGITQLTGLPTPFTFQAVDAATDQPIAPANTPVDIGPASNQKFVVTLTPSEPVCPTDIRFGFNCTNSALAPTLTGVNTLLLTAGAPSGCGLSASVTASQSTFMMGETLIAGGSVTSPGLPGVGADFYVGVLRPDLSIQFFTPTGVVAGNFSDLRSFRPLATNVSLTAPFSVSQPDFHTHQWTVDELPGSYVFFLLAVNAGALSSGTLTDDQILKIATASFEFS